MCACACLCEEVRGEITVLFDLCSLAGFRSVVNTHTHTGACDAGYQTVITPVAASVNPGAAVAGGLCGCSLIRVKVWKDASLTTAEAAPLDSCAALLPRASSDLKHSCSLHPLRESVWHWVMLRFILYVISEHITISQYLCFS